MTRHMSLTLLLMAGSVAAAVAAPDLGSKAEPNDCVELRIVASDAWKAGAVRKQQVVGLPARQITAEQSPSDACVLDVTEPYRLWHHGSAKVVPGCGAAAST